MKATGIVRRIDGLGRIVIPKEIRRSLRIREGESMEILVSSDGEIILTKNSPAQGIEPLAGEYVEALAELTRATACVCDRYQVIAAAGPQSGNCLYQRIHEDLQQCIEDRKSVV